MYQQYLQGVFLMYQQYLKKSPHRLIYFQHQSLSLLNVEIATI